MGKSRAPVNIDMFKCVCVCLCVCKVARDTLGELEKRRHSLECFKATLTKVAHELERLIFRDGLNVKVRLNGDTGPLGGQHVNVARLDLHHLATCHLKCHRLTFKAAASLSTVRAIAGKAEKRFERSNATQFKVRQIKGENLLGGFHPGKVSSAIAKYVECGEKGAANEGMLHIVEKFNAALRFDATKVERHRGDARKDGTKLDKVRTTQAGKGKVKHESAQLLKSL